jgi:hypothetical protein
MPTAAVKIAKPTRRQSKKTVFDPHHQVRSIVALLGNNATAELVGVSKSQPSLWLRRGELMSPQSRQRVSELYFVLDRLTQTIDAGHIVDWLNAPKARLAGATPAQVFRLKGPGPVIEVIEAIDEGAYL